MNGTPTRPLSAAANQALNDASCIIDQLHGIMDILIDTLDHQRTMIGTAPVGAANAVRTLLDLAEKQISTAREG